jgi:hypothetical protein
MTNLPLAAFISDAILVILPILILRLLTSYPSTRQTLMLLFSASALITVTQIVHTILMVMFVSGASLAFSAVVRRMARLPQFSIINASLGICRCLDVQPSRASNGHLQLHRVIHACRR